MLRLFRYVAIVEGVTTLALFLVAMPAKYWFGNADLVPPLGMVHGMAWIIYIVIMFPALWVAGSGASGWLRTFAASLVPFGIFINDAYLKSMQDAFNGSGPRDMCAGQFETKTRN